MRWSSAPTNWRAARSALKPLRDAAAAQRSRPLADVADWAPSCATHNPVPFALRLSRSPMATQLDLEEQEQLDQLKAFWKQYGNLITWVLIAALAAFAGLERLELVAARPGGEGRRDVRRTRPCRAGRRRRQGRPRLRRHEGALSRAPPSRSRAACWRPRCSSTRARPMRRGHAGLGGRATRPRPNTRPSPACAWPALLLDDKKYDEALKQLDAARRQGVRGAGGRPPRRRAAGPGQARRGQGGLPEGLARRWTRRSTTGAWSKPS